MFRGRETGFGEGVAGRAREVSRTYFKLVAATSNRIGTVHCR